MPAILLVVLLQVCGGDGARLADVLTQLEGQVPVDAATRDPNRPDPQADLVSYVSFTLDDVQATWDDVFTASGLAYSESELVLYEQGTSTAGCGYGRAAVGPFYCPADHTTYLDLAFFEDLVRRFDAPGDFAQSYVIAHEVGHHVQNLIGISDQVRSQQQARPDDANDLSVLLELQADCFAGVWAAGAYAEDLLERGDLDEALRAAEAIGDDAIQAQAGQPVNPETWTHGSSDQRRSWFMTGFTSGDPNRCDTFAQ